VEEKLIYNDICVFWAQLIIKQVSWGSIFKIHFQDLKRRWRNNL